MGLFTKSKLSSDENRKLKLLKNEVQRSGADTATLRFASYVDDCSDDLLEEMVECYKSASSHFAVNDLLNGLIYRDVSYSNIARVFHILNKNENFADEYIGMISAYNTCLQDHDLAQIYKLFTENGLKDHIDTASFLKLSFQYNHKELAKECLKHAIQENKKFSPDTFYWQKLSYETGEFSGFLIRRLEDFYKISRSEPKQLTEEILGVLAKDFKNNEQTIDLVLEYYRYVENLPITDLNCEVITASLSEEKNIKRILAKLGATSAVKNKIYKTRAANEYDLAAFYKIGITDLGDQETLDKLIKHSLAYCEHIQIVDILDMGFKFKDVDKDVLLNHLPQFIKKMEEGHDVKPILLSVKKHPDAKEIFVKILKSLAGETSAFERQKECFEYMELSDEEIIPLLMSSLGNESLGYLSRFYIEQITDFKSVGKDFFEKVACVKQVDIVQSMIDKGLVFGEHMEQVKKISYKNNSNDMDHFFAKLETQEKMDIYPIWRKKSDDIIEEVSLIEVISEKKTLTLSRRFNFKAGIMDMIYNTHEADKLVKMQPAQTLLLSDLSAEFVKEAEARLKSNGELSNDNVQPKKSVPLPKPSSS